MTTTLTAGQIQERSNRYADLSRLKLHQAQQALENDDLSEAGNNAYGAFIDAVKACAELRNWNHHNNLQIHLTIEQLAAENAAPNLMFAHLAAESLHSNYFEHELSAPYIKSAIAGVSVAIDQLEAIRLQPAPPPEPKDPMSARRKHRLEQLTRTGDEPPETADELPPFPKRG